MHLVFHVGKYDLHSAYIGANTFGKKRKKTIKIGMGDVPFDAWSLPNFKCTFLDILHSFQHFFH